MIQVTDFIVEWPSKLFPDADLAPWRITHDAMPLIRQAQRTLPSAYELNGEIARHKSARIESGAQIKGPVILGPGSFVSSSALLRGGVWIGQDCIIGPCCEIKTVFMAGGSKVAHLSFVGDSLLGSGVNVEAGAMIANYRNERVDKRIRILWRGEVLDTGVDKFGSLIGDGARIGANAVIAPGAILAKGAIVRRLQLIDQSPPE